MLSYFTETYVFRLRGGICGFFFQISRFLAIIVFSRTIQFMFNLMLFEISRCYYIFLFFSPTSAAEIFGNFL